MIEQESKALFSQRVYQLVKQILSGSVKTYGEIAWMMGKPKAARQVGQALAHCRDESVPCHRVVNAKGQTAPGFIEQKQLLMAESVPFLEDGRVDLCRCRAKDKRGENHG